MTSSSSFGATLLILLAIDLMLFLGQIAVTEIAPDMSYYNDTGNLLGTEDQGNYTLSEITDINSILPTATQGVTSDTDGNIFTDL